MAVEATGAQGEPPGGVTTIGQGADGAEPAVAGTGEVSTPVPLRLVVRDEEEVVSLSDGRSYVRRVEVLACGHRQAPRYDRYGEYSVSRRRCLACGALATAGELLPEVHEFSDEHQQRLAKAACSHALEPVARLARGAGWAPDERRSLTELALALGAAQVEPGRGALRLNDFATAIDALEVVVCHKAALSTDVADAIGPVRQLLDGTWIRFARWYATHPSSRNFSARKSQGRREVTLKLLVSKGF